MYVYRYGLFLTCGIKSVSPETTIIEFLNLIRFSFSTYFKISIPFNLGNFKFNKITSISFLLFLIISNAPFPSVDIFSCRLVTH